MVNLWMGLTAIAGTLLAYWMGLKLHARFPYRFMIPVVPATFVIIVLLLWLDIPYETYMTGGQWINKLLGPAVVALAYPLYHQRELLKKMLLPIIGGTFIGGLIGVSTGIWLAKWAGFSDIIISSLGPKSVTTPVAMAVADAAGGITPLAAVFVMIAGIGGVVMSSFILKYFRIDHYLGRGVGMGCASHAIGTASAMEAGQLEGSVSTVSMVVSAVFVSIITPLLVIWWL